MRHPRMRHPRMRHDQSVGRHKCIDATNATRPDVRSLVLRASRSQQRPRLVPVLRREAPPGTPKSGVVPATFHHSSRAPLNASA
jgi:hypothetical protein